MANLIRVKQLDQADLSGFFNTAFINTGIIDATYVDKFTDESISGIKTFVDGVNLNNIDNLSLSGVDITITSGNVVLTNAISAPNLLNLTYNTGNQIISGVKTFATGIIAPNLVYNTGNQNIDGSKVFNGGISLFSGVTFFRENGLGDLDIDLLNRPYLNTRVSIGTDTGILGQSINTLNTEREIKIWETGGVFTAVGYGPYIRIGRSGVLISEKTESKVGVGILFPTEKVHISGGNLKVEGTTIATNLVYNTGNQTISGVKTFASRPTVNGTGVLLSGQSPAISDSLVTHIRPSGTNNVFVSSTALASTSIGSQNNIAVGVNALTANVVGDDNVAMGHEALYSNTNGNSNIGIGRDALKNANGPDANICIGTQAGDTIQAGGSNIIIGHEADVDNDGRQRCIVLGRSAISPAIDGSLAIGGTAGNAMANLNVTGAGAAAVGEYLNIYINGVQRKIALLLP